MSKYVFFDFDNTLTDFNSWEKFNSYSGISNQEDQQMFKDYLENTISYDDWISKIETIIKQKNILNQNNFGDFTKSLQVTNNAKEIIRKLIEADYQIIIISGAIEQIVSDCLAEFQSIEIHSTSKIKWANNGQLDQIIHSGDERKAKLDLFLTACQKYNLDPKKAIYIGDGGNDLEIFKTTKSAVLLGNNDLLRPFAKNTISNLNQVQQILNNLSTG